MTKRFESYDGVTQDGIWYLAENRLSWEEVSGREFHANGVVVALPLDVVRRCADGGDDIDAYLALCVTWSTEFLVDRSEQIGITDDGENALFHIFGEHTGGPSNYEDDD